MEPTKCNYHHIRYSFKPSGEPVLLPGDTFSRSLNIADVNGKVTEIKALDNNKAEDFRGYDNFHWMAPFETIAGDIKAVHSDIVHFGTEVTSEVMAQTNPMGQMSDRR